MTQLITIQDTLIRMDAQGRYCLNDLHKASGEEIRNRPATWLQNQQTKNLAVELEKDGIPSIHTKQGLGTFVRKELVYAYAMWISPAFNLKVIRTFEAVTTQQRLPTSFAEALQLAADQAKQLELAAPKIRHFDQVAERSTLLNTTQVAQQVKLSAQKLNQYLESFEVYNKSVVRGRVFKQWFLQAGYGIMRQTENGFAQPMFTTQGEAWIIDKLLNEGLI
ncbi:KilA-N domain-containing protein [Acinetobacter sp. ANC 4640]